MSKNLKSETLPASTKAILNNTPVVLALVQQAEFQHLRAEFEKILDDYLQKVPQVGEGEVSGLIHYTTENLNTMLKKVAVMARNNDSVADVENN